MRRSRATIVDIADELGIHATSVSRALSGSSEVSEATRQRVLDAADRLNYVRNVHAAGLVTGSSNIVGLLVPDLANPFFAELANQVQIAAMARGYLVMVATSQMSSEQELEIVNRMIENVDGTIVAIPTTDMPHPKGPAGGGRVAFINRHVAGAPSFVVDQEAIVRLQIDVLVAAGHRSIAAVDGPDVFESTRVRESHRRRLAPPDVQFLDVGRFEASGRDAAAAYTAIPPEATAVMVFNDIMALGVMAAAVADGRDVPGDLSIVGSDGLDIARLITPQLTTVRAPLERLADRVVAWLGDADAGEVEVVVEPELVEGQSVARRTR